MTESTDTTTQVGSNKPTTGDASADGTDAGSDATDSESDATDSESDVMDSESDATDSDTTDTDDEAMPCEPNAEQQCWEDETGEPLPELTGGVRGSCRKGTQTCTEDGQWGPCEGAVGPLASDRCEVSGADDDCNGVANENCSCTGSETRECGTETGNCELGTQSCDGSTWGDCEGGVEPAERDSCSVEGDDANCDGEPNDGCECIGNATEACGDCGTRTCDPATGTWGECAGDGQVETCWESAAGVALPGAVPTNPLGNCKLGSKTCGADGDWTPCTGAVAPQAQDTCDPGDDADCDGTANEGCTCSTGETRVCGKDTGNCEVGEQACQADFSWGDCVGEVVAESADSCEVSGDDANCNGVENEGCECTADAPEACDDGLPCTDEVCTNGMCSNPVKAGFCLIGGACQNHNANDKTNQCRYCDAGISQTSWTNWSATKACDDGVWCNGDDTCNGSGDCLPSGSRCPSSGPCVLATCDEANQQCYKPSTVACEEDDEYACSGASTTCGTAVQTRRVTRYCDGASAACLGEIVEENWQTETQCRADQVCNGSTFACVAGGTPCPIWCDPTTNLCWQTTVASPAQVSYESAVDVCSSASWGGFDWRLPTVAEWTEVLEECAGVGCDTSPTPAGCVWGGVFASQPCGIYWTSDTDSGDRLALWAAFGAAFTATDYAAAFCVIDN